MLPKSFFNFENSVYKCNLNIFFWLYTKGQNKFHYYLFRYFQVRLIKNCILLKYTELKLKTYTVVRILKLFKYIK